MPIVKVYTDSLSLRGYADDGNIGFFYNKTKTAYGETEGKYLDDFVHTAVISALEASEWVTLNKPEGYLLEDDCWQVLLTKPELVRGVQSSPLNYFPSLVITAVKMRNQAILETAKALAEQGNTTVEKILPKAEKPVKHSSLSKMEYSTDPYIFEEIASYGYTGAQFDEMMDTANNEGYLYQQRRLACQWQ